MRANDCDDDDYNKDRDEDNVCGSPAVRSLLSESTVIMLNCLIKCVLLKLCLVSSIPRLRVENET